MAHAPQGGVRPIYYDSPYLEIRLGDDLYLKLRKNKLSYEMLERLIVFLKEFKPPDLLRPEIEQETTVK